MVFINDSLLAVVVFINDSLLAVVVFINDSLLAVVVFVNDSLFAVIYVRGCGWVVTFLYIQYSQQHITILVTLNVELLKVTTVFFDKCSNLTKP